MIPYVFWAAVAVCAVAQLFILGAAVRVKTEDRAAGSVPRSSRAAEIGWTLVPAIGLAALLFFTHRALQERTSVPTAAHEHVQVLR